jgi:PKD repeat protein
VSGPAGAALSFDTVSPTITVEITHTLGSIVVSDTVHFTATASSDGTPLSYAWDLGDGTTASGLVASHVYTQDGSYTVAFTATDACGYSEVQTATVTVNAPTLVADFVPSSADVVVNNSVVFTDTSTTDGPPIVAWAWTFGDGGTSNAQNPSHLYTSVGTYTVGLVVTDALGYSDDEVKTDLVTVVPSCLSVTGLAFEYAPASPVIQLPVVFTASVTGGSTPIAYAWQFDDGGSDSGQTVTHTFALTGTHTVTVTASNACSAPTYSDTVNVVAFRVFLPLVIRSDCNRSDGL